MGMAHAHVGTLGIRPRIQRTGSAAEIFLELFNIRFTYLSFRISEPKMTQSESLMSAGSYNTKMSRLCTLLNTYYSILRA